MVSKKHIVNRVLLFSLFVFTLIASCNVETETKTKTDIDEEEVEVVVPDVITSDNGWNFTVIVIDGCEYLYNHEKKGWGDKSREYESMTHKGNCSNPEHNETGE